MQLKNKKEELKKHLCFHPQVNNVYKINDGWDFIIETVHRNIKELDDFLEQLNQKYEIQAQQVHYLIEDIKREGFVIE